MLDQKPHRHRARDLCQQWLAFVARSQTLQAGSGDVGALPLRWEELYQFSRQILGALRLNEAVARLWSDASALARLRRHG